MAYLVQRHFKNSFRDFRTKDVEFYEDLQVVQPNKYYWQGGSIFKTEEAATDFGKFFEAHGAMYEVTPCKSPEHEGEFSASIFIPEAKVWKLTDGEFMPNAQTYKYFDNIWAPAKSVDKQIASLEAQFMQENGYKAA